MIKINHFTNKDGFTNNEIIYLKNKILNDKLGLVLNFEQTDEKLDKNYVGLCEDKKYDINSLEKNNHLIIEGDNYHTLSFFKLIHFKVDVIYIDPPYNTGNNDFKYNDVFISKDDTYKHSKWLSFMQKRLKIAKDLLNDNGVIFISIDDNEQAYLKVLCDEIFGEENFVGNIIWSKKNYQFGAKNLQKNHEYILVYSKNDISSNKILYIKGTQEKKLLVDEKNQLYYRDYSLDTSFGHERLCDRPTMGYVVYFNQKNKDIIIDDQYDLLKAKKH